MLSKDVGAFNQWILFKMLLSFVSSGKPHFSQLQPFCYPIISLWTDKSLSSTSNRFVSMKRRKRWRGKLEWWWFFFYCPHSQTSLMVSPRLGRLPELPFRMFTEVFSYPFVSPRGTDLSSSARIQINKNDLFVAVACFIVSFQTMLYSTCFHYSSVLFLMLCGLERVLRPNMWSAPTLRKLFLEENGFHISATDLKMNFLNMSCVSMWETWRVYICKSDQFFHYVTYGAVRGRKTCCLTMCWEISHDS